MLFKCKIFEVCTRALSGVEFSQWGGRFRVCLALQGNTGELGSQTFSIILNYGSSAWKLPLSNTRAYLWGRIQGGVSLKSAFCLTLDITVRSRELNCTHSRGFPPDFSMCKHGGCILLEFNKPLIHPPQPPALFWPQWGWAHRDDARDMEGLRECSLKFNPKKLVNIEGIRV